MSYICVGCGESEKFVGILWIPDPENELFYKSPLCEKCNVEFTDRFKTGKSFDHFLGEIEGSYDFPSDHFSLCLKIDPLDNFELPSYRCQFCNSPQSDKYFVVGVGSKTSYPIPYYACHRCYHVVQSVDRWSHVKCPFISFIEVVGDRIRSGRYTSTLMTNRDVTGKLCIIKEVVGAHYVDLSDLTHF